jgi:regulatory protein
VPRSLTAAHIAAVRTFRKPKDPPPEPLPGPVTAIREHPRRAGRYTVDVARVPVGPVSVEAIGELGVRVGVELDERALAHLVAAARKATCYDRALDALARRSRSRRDLERWLALREFTAEQIAPAMERLVDLGLLDDAAFARGYARGRLGARGFGPRRVAAELARRGVERSVVDEVLREYAAEQEAAAEGEPDAEARGVPGADTALERAARKRVRALTGLEPRVAHQRLTAWLVRRGFGVGESVRVARVVLSEAAEQRTER